MKKEIEAFVNAANEQELEAAWTVSYTHLERCEWILKGNIL